MYNLTENLFGTKMSADLNLPPVKNLTLLEAFYGINVTSPILNVTRTNTVGNLTFKAFESHAEFDDYVRSRNFG